jgi:cell wall-associated NlpC family hydrolase
MSRVVARSSLAPLYAQPSLRSEQVSQLVLGEAGTVLERTGEWRRISIVLDGYAGWVHGGYVIEMSDPEGDQWQTEAEGWSAGATIRLGDQPLRLPLRARCVLENGGVRLPDGRRGPVAEGSVPRSAQLVSAARAEAPERWALDHFAGAPYEWGGVTPWGVDCSGMVQTTFAARGLILPRDAARQVTAGAPVSQDDIRPGDLVFFRGEESPGITHVAFAGEANTLVHSTVACGGVLSESWLPGTRASQLRSRLEAVRRLEAR